jgi:ketosteroid isomerase-like protein
MDTDNLSANAQVALRGIKVASDRTLEGFRDVCRADIEMNMPFHPNGPFTTRGVEAMIKEFGVEKVFETFSLDPVDLFDCGDRIVIEARSRGTYRSGRPDYCNHYLFVLTIRDGRIARWDEFYNPLEAMKQNYGKPRPDKQAAPSQ